MSGSVDLNPNYLETVMRILAEHVPECEVRAFGSRATWTAKDYSDLDMAIVGEGSLDRRTLGRLKEAFEESSLPMRVDVLDWHATSKSFREVIERDYVVVQEGAKHTTAGEWHEVTLGDVADIVMGQSPPGDTASVDNGLALLNGPTEFGSYHPIPTQFTTDARKYAQPGDILFCVRGSTTGRMNWADQEYAIGRGVAAIRHREEPAIQPFVRGVIELELPGLLAQATGSTFPNVSAPQLAGIPYPRLSKDTQRAIAHVLGTLDNKIELNRRMNETLEAMARAIFQDWFVDFGPTRAKMEGRAPYLSTEVWSLFPDRLADSELSPIPEGWGVRRLEEVVDFREGPGIRNWQYTNSEEGTRFINIRCIQDGDILLTTANRITDEEANGKYAHFHLKEWDVVVSTSGTLGRSAIVRAAHLPLVLNTSVIRFRSVEGITLFAYLYGYLNSRIFLGELEMSATGSVQKNFGPMHLKKILILCPPYNFLQRFEETAGSLLQQMIAKRTESDALAAQRDALLPRLVSGEVGVI